jgi:hypothetical protein
MLSLICPLHKSLGHAKSSQSSQIVSWQWICNSLTVTTAHIKSSFFRLTPLYSFVLLQFSFLYFLFSFLYSVVLLTPIILILQVSAPSPSHIVTDSQSVSLMTRYLLLSGIYSLVFVGRPLWREDGTAFCICCWPCQCRLSRVWVPWDLRPYFTVSDLRLPFLSLPMTRWVTVEVFDPASTRGAWTSTLYRLWADHLENTLNNL